MSSKKLACYFGNMADALNRYKTSAKEHQELHSSLNINTALNIDFENFAWEIFKIHTPNITSLEKL